MFQLRGDQMPGRLAVAQRFRKCIQPPACLQPDAFSRALGVTPAEYRQRFCR